ncbi:MAG: phage tail protein [Enterobacteriaceae bacterium]
MPLPPEGWFKCNGASFDKKLYPLLALAYPDGKLPDLRGEFLRGWDDGRGVDVGRNMLSWQSDAIRNIVGVFGINGRTAHFGSVSGVFSATEGVDYVGGGDNSKGGISFDASRVVPTAADNRPRNIAFNFIVRAA